MNLLALLPVLLLLFVSKTQLCCEWIRGR